MYLILLTLHSLFRWLVLLSLGASLYKAFRGYTRNTSFSKADNALRHWTATIAHLQLTIGIILYIKSPVTHYFRTNPSGAMDHRDSAFFGLYHSLLMLAAVVVITIGSALAKRRKTDKEKFRTMLIWFGLGLIIILLAIPWPFSPLAHRPYFRTF